MPALKNFNPPVMVATDVEIWRNDAAGGTTILKIDPLGNVRGERIQPGGTTSVTPLERRLNHDRAAGAKLDPFLNGRLSPVRLLDSEPDTAILKLNPNSLSETEVKEVFKLKATAFVDRLNAITNPIVLERMLKVADEVDASVNQVKAIDARLDEI
jgi:hypothetical protein